MSDAKSSTLTVLLQSACAIGVASIATLAMAAGPAAGVNVNVVNPSSSPVPVTIQGTDVPLSVKATATAISQSAKPTCDVLNRCSVAFPAVPANKQLRVTRILGVMYFDTFNAFVALDRNNLNSQLFVLPVAPLPAGYLSTVLSFNERTDFVFKAGEIPIVEIGTSAANSFEDSGDNILGITGELSDAP